MNHHPEEMRDPEYAEVIAVCRQLREIASTEGFNELVQAARSASQAGQALSADLVRRELERLPEGVQIQGSDFGDGREILLCLSAKLPNGVTVAINY
jgi:hypothetical protein